MCELVLRVRMQKIWHGYRIYSVQQHTHHVYSPYGIMRYCLRMESTNTTTLVRSPVTDRTALCFVYIPISHISHFIRASSSITIVVDPPLGRRGPFNSLVGYYFRSALFWGTEMVSQKIRLIARDFSRILGKFCNYDRTETEPYVVDSRGAPLLHWNRYKLG